MKLLLYGTLMNIYDGELIIVKGTMIDFGPYPGLIIGDGDTDIECLVAYVDKDALKQMDYYEGVADNFYVREKVDDYWYYKPKGVIKWHNQMRYAPLMEVKCKNKPFNWLEYKKNDSKEYSKENISEERLVRLAKS
jgi:gamma-glutamylcyclotransferase (GGCT)/AIG2-like uncharacterized protein YtfP